MEPIDLAYLYAGAMGAPGKVIKIDLNTFQLVDKMFLNTGENGAHALAVTDEYLYVGTMSGSVIRIRLSDFTRVNAIQLPSGFSQIMTLHVFGNYLYVTCNTGQVARLDPSTLSFIDYVETPNKIWGRDSIQVGNYLYISSHDGESGPSYLQKIRVTDLYEVDVIQLSMRQAHFMLAVGDYIYIASNWTTPAGIMKVDTLAFQEVDSVQFTNDGKGDADFVVRYGDYLLANGDSSPGRVYRTRLSDFAFMDYLDLSENRQSDLEVLGKYLYLTNVAANPASIIKVDLDTFQEVDKLYTPGENTNPQIAISGEAPPPPTHTLTVQSTPNGVPFTIH